MAMQQERGPVKYPAFRLLGTALVLAAGLVWLGFAIMFAIVVGYVVAVGLFIFGGPVLVEELAIAAGIVTGLCGLFLVARAAFGAWIRLGRLP